ncbi:LOW QUALITY PROTEIN: NUT family member 2D-like, partial [Mustela putorius furo]|uniref:LOW QUALITY PROTEIN: NUT family member 2D-like n=1 Tax=Mustela putorius furo TaxID=9669 RepID=A0A8U0UMW0_MUSPF
SPAAAHRVGPGPDFCHCGGCQAAASSACADGFPRSICSAGTPCGHGPGSLPVCFHGTALPPPPTAGAPHRPLWGQHPPPLLTQPFPPGGPLVLPAFSRTPLVAGEAGLGPNGTGTCNVTVQVRSEQGCSVTPQTQTIVLTPAPLSWSAPGALGGGAACPAPIFVTASAVETSMPASARGGSQAGKGGLAPSLPPPAQPPVAQLTTVVPPVNARPQPHGASRSRTTASPQDSCNPKSVYENFRRWQRFKSLARRHLPHSPDAEALSCFLIPVLRTLARLKPKMTLEEGVRRAVQEWQSKSNFDRLIYYEMAGKFMEFEMEEEMQMRKLQWVKVAQGLPPPAPPKPERRGPPAAGAGPQPACVPRKAGSRAQPSRLQPHRPPRRRQTKAPKEIPPEAVREYVDIMEGLLGPGRSAPGGPAGEWGEDGKEPQQDEAATSPDPGLLSYLDELCSQEDFITKVEAVIHPPFLAELLSSEPQLDLLALAEKLEQEEGLSPAEVSPGKDGLQASCGMQGTQAMQGEGVGSQVSPRRGPKTETHMTLSPFASCESQHWGGQRRGGTEQRMGMEDGQPGTGGREGLGGCQQSHSLVGHPPCLPRCHRPMPPSHWPMLASHCPLFPQLVVEKRLAALNTEEGVQAPPRLCAARSGPSAEHETGPGMGLGVSDKACPADTDGQDLQRHGRAQKQLSGPGAFALCPGRQEAPAPRARRVPAPPEGQRCAAPGPGPRDAPLLREAPPARDTRGLVDGSSEDEEELPSLAFLLASQHRLLPWRLSQSPAPASVIPSPGGWGPQGAPRAPLSSENRPRCGHRPSYKVQEAGSV